MSITRFRETKKAPSIRAHVSRAKEMPRSAAGKKRRRQRIVGNEEEEDNNNNNNNIEEEESDEDEEEEEEDDDENGADRVRRRVSVVRRPWRLCRAATTPPKLRTRKRQTVDRRTAISYSVLLVVVAKPTTDDESDKRGAAQPKML